MANIIPTNHLEDCINKIKQKAHPYNNNYKNALALSLGCAVDHDGIISAPAKSEVLHVRDIRLRLEVNDYDSLIESKIVLTTNMCLEYVAYLTGAEINRKFEPKYRKRINKNRYTDFFGDFPQVGRNNENLYSYGALLVLSGLNGDQMPIINLSSF